MFYSITESNKLYKYENTGNWDRITNRRNRRVRKQKLKKKIKELLQ